MLSALGRRWSLVGTSVVSEMQASGRAARIDDYAGLEGEIAEECRRVGIRSTVGIPIAVGGRTWGAMVVSSTDAQPLPADTEERLADFTELLATAIANSEAQAEVARLAEEQAALRRVAHSTAGHAEVVARIDDGTLRVEVRDDGVGGASPEGNGLVGLADRLAVLDGRLEVDSPPGGGARLTVAIPLRHFPSTTPAPRRWVPTRSRRTCAPTDCSTRRCLRSRSRPSLTASGLS
jgi:GAF domain-containing protein